MTGSDINRKLKILTLVFVTVAALALSGCRARVTNLPDSSRVIPDENGYMQEEYEMRRDELGLYETRESVFSRFSSGEDYDDSEYYDEEFDEMMDDYRESEYEDEDDDDQDTQNNRPVRTGTTTRPRPIHYGGGTTPKPTTVKITLDANGGNFDGEATSSVTGIAGSAYGKLPVPVYEGYSFVGWFTAAEEGDEVTEETLVVNKEDHSLYAHWKQDTVASYRITFDPGEGSISSGDSVKTVRKGDTYGSFPSAVYDGHDLAGWFTAAEGGDPVSEADTFDGEEDVTLYAQWTYNAFKYWSSQLDSVSVNDDDRANCYIETGDHETTSKSSLLNNSQANNVAGSKDKTVTDEWILSKDPDVVIKVVSNMDDASSAVTELRERLAGWEGKILIVPKDAVSGSDNEKLYYTIDLSRKLYGTFADEEVSQAGTELEVSGSVYE